MRKLILALGLMGLAAFTSPVEAWDEWDWSGCETEADLGVGYRRDNLKWTIAGPNGFPNILSSLDWKGLGICQIVGTARVVTQNHIYARAKADYGVIVSGKNIDSDYLGNDRTFEISRTKNDAGKGEVYDLTAGVGYQFSFFCDSLKIAPLVGYSHNEQHLRQYHGNQVIGFVFSGGRFPGLHSNYRAKWQGPWIGVDASYDIDCSWNLYGSLEYHWAHYHGTGHWNLNTAFIRDFKQTSQDASGGLVTIGATYLICDGWTLGIELNYIAMKVHHGRDRVYFDFGTFGSKLNSVKWHSASYLATVGYKF
jgi:Protochlamydia outer membrane protein